MRPSSPSSPTGPSGDAAGAKAHLAGGSSPAATSGIILTTLTYVMWGVLPLFWALLNEVDAIYVLASRIVWSALFMGVYLALRGSLRAALAALRTQRNLAVCLVCGVLISANWGIYIYAVIGGHVLDASLGYFIEPVMVMLIGLLFFRERPSRLEVATFVLSSVALVYLLVAAGGLPLIALAVSSTFAVYGAVKKNLDLPGDVSLFLETLLMSPFALALIVVLDAQGAGGLAALHGLSLLLLPAGGLVTTIPMLLFNLGVRRIPYYLTGILMYVNPTLQFLIGVLALGERLDTVRLTAFVVIWAGVACTLADRIRKARQVQQESAHSGN